MTTDSPPRVYAAIAAVAARMAAVGVGKTRQNVQQKYAFRGIDDFYNVLAPALAGERLVILPRCVSRETVERKSSSGGALFYTTVAVEFDFVAAEDGSKHTAGPFYGEAMDSGDKATNKAMSAAYKYCVMQCFAIPVEGQTLDSEADSHDVEPAAYNKIEEAALQTLRDAAMSGTDALKVEWSKLSDRLRERLRAELPSLKQAAAQGAINAA